MKEREMRAPVEQPPVGEPAVVTKFKAIASGQQGSDRMFTLAEGIAVIAHIEGQAAEIARLQILLNGRDDFIVKHGLWGDFVASLPASGAIETGGEGGKP